MLDNLIAQLQNSFQEIWNLVISFLPSLIGAFVILIIGTTVAIIAKKIIMKVFEAVKVDQALRSVGVEEYMKHSGLKLNLGMFVGVIVYWFVMLVFVLAAADILHFSSLSDFVKEILNYIPNIIVAALILSATLVVGKFLKELMERIVMGARLHGAKMIGLVTWWIVVVFGIVAIFQQLNIALQLVNTLLLGLVAMLALAGGLAFGLGGKEFAAHLLEKVKHAMEGN